MNRLTRIRDLFPQEVAVEDAVPGEVKESIFPEEEAAITRAVEKRRREFVAGRVCAHRAMERLGVPRAPILHGGDRAPQWPDGLAGTISHTDGYCVAAVVPRGRVASLGIDVEPDQAIKPELFSHICSEAELDSIRGIDANLGRAVRICFSAKEAFYKCQYLLSEQFLGFHDVELTLAGDRFEIELRKTAGPFPLGHRFLGRILRVEGFVVTTMALFKSQVP